MPLQLGNSRSDVADRSAPGRRCCATSCGEGKVSLKQTMRSYFAPYSCCVGMGSAGAPVPSAHAGKEEGREPPQGREPPHYYSFQCRLGPTSLEEAKYVLQQRVLQLYKDDDRMRHDIYTEVSKLPDDECHRYLMIYVTEDTVNSPYLAMAAKVWLGLLLPRVAPRNRHLGAAAPQEDASVAAKADVAAEVSEVAEKEKLARQQAIEDGAKVFDDFVDLLGALVQLVVLDVKETFGGQLSRLSRYLSNDLPTKLKTS